MRHFFDDPTSGDGDYQPLTKEETKYIYMTAGILLAILGIATLIISKL